MAVGLWVVLLVLVVVGEAIWWFYLRLIGSSGERHG
jgi:hypothetical protein